MTIVSFTPFKTILVRVGRLVVLLVLTQVVSCHAIAVRTHELVLELLYDTCGMNIDESYAHLRFRTSPFCVCHRKPKLNTHTTVH